MFVTGAAVFSSIGAIGLAALWRRTECRLREHRRLAREVARDHTAAEANAKQAREEAERLHQMLDALPLPVWRCAGNRAVIECNPAYRTAFGGSREGIPAEARDLVPIGRGDPTACVGGAIEQGGVHVVIGGERRLLSIYETTGTEDGTIGFALDCTEVESARSELRRHTTAHTAVLEILSAAVAIFGPDKRLKFFNGAFAALWGLDTAWLASEPMFGEILERLHESRRFPEYPDFRAFKRERCALFTSLVEPRHELMHLPDGRTLQLTISPHPFGGLIYVFDDVSDRLALECSYNTLAAVQRATLDHLFEGIAVYGGDGRLKLHNPAFRALWGLSEADVAGEPHISEIVERTRGLLDDGENWAAKREDMVIQVTSQTLASGTLYRRDGSVLQIASMPLPDGEVLMTYLDVSDTARVEHALRERNEALETAARLKAEFVANVSHELRTPLNTIIGFAEILHNQYFGPLNSSQLEYSGGILDSAQQLTGLINDTIELASIEASYIELERGPVDIPDMLRTLLGLTQERARSRGLDIELCCPAEIDAIEGDKRRLQQALFNLISNAIRFTPPGGIIRIEAKQGRGELLLRVCDTGIGMAGPVSSSKFEPIAPVRKHRNASLGLSLVKRLIELHGGSVEFGSAPGQGHWVTCQLPMIRSEPGGTGVIGLDWQMPQGGDSRCTATV
jgi:signal transduction histidine kinase/HAMP domain-containing protein